MRKWLSSWFLVAALATMAVSCGDDSDEGTALDQDVLGDLGKADHPGGTAGPVEPLNTEAGKMIVYELQVRSANACIPETGGESCKRVLGPQFEYFGTGCDQLADLQHIKKSTLDDLLYEDGQPSRTQGITLQYIDEVVGANTVWLMPIHPHNYQYNLPHHCDDLGSPYAIRDYYHVRGTLANRCVQAGRDEWSDSPCWGNPELETLVDKAHAKGMKVMMDLAFNHLGHEYLYYDYADARPVREMLADGEDLWDFQGTYDEALVWPEILDTPDELPAEAPEVVSELCGTAELGQGGVRRYLMWREAFDHERKLMDCEVSDSLENQVPGFYLGSDQVNPSTGLGDNFSNNWADVKFLYNNERNVAHQWEFARTREFAFRVVNYYLSIGVDAFRLDHANGLTENEWRYVFRKAKFYQQKRGLPTPVFMSESFHNIEELNRVFDILTEGYHHDISHGTRDTSYIEKTLFTGRENWLGLISYVLMHLENHDEGRLLKPSTGFDVWRGATFYAISAASRGTLMLMTGQEWGEPWDLGFRRSDYLRGRFPTEANWNPKGDELTELYRSIHQARLDPKNVALVAGKHFFLRMEGNRVKDQLFAMVKYMEDCSNTLFTFNRLWVDDVEATYMVTQDLAGKICLGDNQQYRLVNVFTGENVWEDAYPGGVRTGRHIRDFGIYVHLTLAESFQWLRLEAE